MAASAASGADVTVVPGAKYQAGPLHRFFFGRHYRDLWTTPLSVPVLDLRTTAGGLTPKKLGGGLQTKSLRFQGADGREYVFRSLDKDPSAVLPEKLRETVFDRILQDQISSEHPAGALVVAPLLAAAGVLHTEPRIVVLPDDPALRDYRQFVGLLGTFEERPDDDGVPFAGASKVIGTDKLLERLQKDPREHVDAREYLKARLMDVFLGDWDRHEGQWRWARLGETKASPWLPIPRDRDQAFVRLDGLIPSLGHFYAPQLVGFRERYPGLLGLHWNSKDLDRRLLQELPRGAWDETAASLKQKLTDGVIDGAVARLPREYVPLNGADLSRALKLRRDALPEAARRFYALLAREVDVRLTDADERVEARRAGGRLEVAAYPLEGKAARTGEPSYRRTFDPAETREVRLYLGGGDDQVSADAGGKPRLRVIPEGNDRVEGAEAERRPYAPPAGPDAKLAAPRDWGHLWLPGPLLSVAPDVGLVIGGGPIYYKYGFRQDPYALRLSLKAAFAVEPARAKVEATADVRRPSSPTHLTLLARASGIEVLHFYGFGNETPRVEDDDFYRVEQRQYELAPALAFDVVPRAVATLGPVVKYASTELEDDRFITHLRPYGTRTFGQAGLRGGLRLDTRDLPEAARHGLLADVSGTFYPELWDADEAFGEVHGEVATYLSCRGKLQPTLALRAAGKKVWGTFPFHEAAFVGGRDTVRGFSEQRFAGDAAAWGNAELRVFLTDFFLVLPGELGVFALGDAGRVWLRGESSSKWHAAVGGGLWFAFVDRTNTITFGVARSGERTGFYIRSGFLF